MRHAKKRYQLNRFTSWRRATLKVLARNTLLYQSIRTTLNKAKAAQPLVDKLIYLAKLNTLAAKRHAFEILGDHKLVSMLFKEIGPRFTARGSGFTKIINLGQRRGDNASIVIFELTEIKKKDLKKKKEKQVKPKDSEGEITKEHPPVLKEEHPVVESQAQEKPPISKKPTKKFLGGLRNIFKKERDSL